LQPDDIMNDLDLFEAIQEGDLYAYKKMFLKYYAPLCTYAAQFLSDTDAKELVQDLMLYIWEARTHLIIATSLKSYLFIAVKNRSFNAIRKQKYRERIHAKLYSRLDEEQLDDPDFYMADELAIKINDAINDLPESYRKTFEMSRFEGLTNAKISSTLDVSIKTVEYRITKSLKILRGKLKDYMTLFL